MKHKEENGKYFIYVTSSEKLKLRGEEEVLRVKLEAELLRTQIRQLKEENNELKMLVDIYEKAAKPVRSETPPELPINL